MVLKCCELELTCRFPPRFVKEYHHHGCNNHNGCRCYYSCNYSAESAAAAAAAPAAAAAALWVDVNNCICYHLCGPILTINQS